MSINDDGGEDSNEDANKDDDEFGKYGNEDGGEDDNEGVNEDGRCDKKDNEDDLDGIKNDK